MNIQIGHQLRQAREAQNISQAQAARDTLIRMHYLQALETGDTKAIPSTAQARGFLRAYADYLGLDAGSIFDSLNGLALEKEPVDPTESFGIESPDTGSTPATGNSPASDSSPVSGSTPVTESSPADELFQQIGNILKQQRSLLGLTLEDVERHTHLRQRYLAALEIGNLSNLPSPVQGRGMLKNYATFLGLDPEPVLMLFAEALQAQLVANQAANQVSHPKQRREPARPARPLPGPLQRLLSGELLVGALLSIVLISFVVWGAARIFRVQAENPPSPTAPSIAEVLLTTPSTTPSPTPPPTTPTALPAVFPGLGEESPTAETPGALSLPNSQQGVQVYISVYQRAYIQVWADGEEVFQGRVLAGSAYNFEGEERVELLTSNGAALQVFYNQQDQGILGLFGQAIFEVYTLEGVQTPTPTITVTSTTTPRPSPTPRQTATPASGAPAIP